MRIIKENDKDFPKRLKEISKYPQEIYVEGDASILNKSMVAIVGSRDCSNYGEKQAKRFAKYLSENNICIVSGLARGVDTIAHIYSKDNVGKTIAVIASGFKNIYPPENKELFYNIVENGGCVISEYAPNVEVDLHRFPRRNRIISGLSQAVLVIEARHKSGSTITARDAFKQKREVFCIPGNIDETRSCGTNLLIQEGANLVLTPQDILDRLSIKEEESEAEFSDKIKEEYRKIYNVLSTIPLTINEVALRAKTTISETIETLTMLELEGKIKSMPGSSYVIRD